MAWDNQTFNSDFILLGIFNYSPTHIFLFSLVLAIFTVAFMGNTAMILLIYLDTQLHTPMYFFLSQLSLMDLMLICNTVPKMAFNHYLSGSNSISVVECATQIFLYTSLLDCECFLWAVMAYDHYIAICYPLRYPNLMSPKICGLMAASSWILGSTDCIIDAVATFFFYCGSREIDHFFCGFPSLLIISCNDTSTFEEVLFYCCIIMIVFPVVIIIASYTRVIVAVIHIASGEGHRKAFATCSSHLMVVGMYYGTALFIYLWPTSDRSPTQEKMVCVFYTILTPMMNPLIYSIHNKEVARAAMKVLEKGKSGQ
ncbi:LOW QUALITY PROTEIN: olfactory receptor 2M3-like [Vulpes vulpes]|uniref:LOW QUALITY PROTEIN: olfactory receptor 2M3-like n=1 Tax=Vulpes vulpes TaxID=9627 RepID=A0A3Q7RLH8_VULVU|nr:LOW QUALITY PROTEIN: olfactory receptor 2M3-like [Vulpes vulpes]